MWDMMEGKGTSTRTGGFARPEVLIASGLALVALLALVLLSLYASRSFAAMANYMDLDQTSRLALDKMSREIRQARHLTDYTPTSLTFQDRDNNPLQFVYDPQARTLSRIGGVPTNIYLTECDSLRFSHYQGNTISQTLDSYAPASVTNTKLLPVPLVCS